MGVVWHKETAKLLLSTPNFWVAENFTFFILFFALGMILFFFFVNIYFRDDWIIIITITEKQRKLGTERTLAHKSRSHGLDMRLLSCKSCLRGELISGHEWHLNFLSTLIYLYERGLFICLHHEEYYLTVLNQTFLYSEIDWTFFLSRFHIYSLQWQYPSKSRICISGSSWYVLFEMHPWRKKQTYQN